MGCGASTPAEAPAPATRSAQAAGVRSKPGPLESAVVRGDVEAVSALLRSGASLAAPEGTTLLRLAAERDGVAVVRLLVARGAPVAPPAGAPSVLEAAAAAGAVATAGLLLDRGSAEKEAALASACQKGHALVVSTLLTPARSRVWCVVRTAVRRCTTPPRAGISKALLCCCKAARPQTRRQLRWRSIWRRTRRRTKRRTTRRARWMAARATPRLHSRILCPCRGALMARQSRPVMERWSSCGTQRTDRAASR